jgi:DNA-binding HxlR family transcriptional regulator
MPAPLFIGRWTPQDLVLPASEALSTRRVAAPSRSISQRMLTRTLRNLESTGLIVRHATKAKTIAVEYSLTPLVRTIIAPLRGMCHWTQHYRRQLSADVYFPEQ